jgi:hypothetical protein
MTTTLKTIRELDSDARATFAAILAEGDLADRRDFEGRPGWDDLVAANLVNCWDDDDGNQYCEIGEQA